MTKLTTKMTEALASLSEAEAAYPSRPGTGKLAALFGASGSTMTALEKRGMVVALCGGRSREYRTVYRLTPAGRSAAAVPARSSGAEARCRFHEAAIASARRKIAIHEEALEIEAAMKSTASAG